MSDSSNSNDSVVKIRNTMYGHLGQDNACGNCIDLDTWTKETTPKFNVPVEYSHVDIDSDPGKAYAEKNKVEGIPASEVCEIYKSGKEECKNYIGPDLVKEKLSSYIKKEPASGPADKEVT